MLETAARPPRDHTKNLAESDRFINMYTYHSRCLFHILYFLMATLLRRHTLEARHCIQFTCVRQQKWSQQDTNEQITHSRTPSLAGSLAPNSLKQFSPCQSEEKERKKKQQENGKIYLVFVRTVMPLHSFTNDPELEKKDVPLYHRTVNKSIRNI